MSEAHSHESIFSDATIIPAESARVGFVVCGKCGASILLDPRDPHDRCKQHVEWHRELEQAWRASR